MIPSIFRTVGVLLAIAISAPVSALDVVYVARHAQKSADAVWQEHGRLRPLTDKGARCAAALGEEVAESEIVAVYASETVRTLGTAAAVSARGPVTVTGDDRSAFEPKAFAADMLRAHAGDGAIVVVGHSNTVGKVVAAFAPGADRCFDALGLRADGTVDEKRYGDVWRIEVGKDACDGGVTRTVLADADGGDCSTP